MDFLSTLRRSSAFWTTVMCLGSAWSASMESGKPSPSESGFVGEKANAVHLLQRQLDVVGDAVAVGVNRRRPSTRLPRQQETRCHRRCHGPLLCCRHSVLRPGKGRASGRESGPTLNMAASEGKRAHRSLPADLSQAVDSTGHLLIGLARRSNAVTASKTTNSDPAAAFLKRRAAHLLEVGGIRAQLALLISSAAWACSAPAASTPTFRS